jgi:hypothetical protein
MLFFQRGNLSGVASPKRKFKEPTLPGKVTLVDYLKINTIYI